MPEALSSSTARQQHLTVSTEILAECKTLEKLYQQHTRFELYQNCVTAASMGGLAIAFTLHATGMIDRDQLNLIQYQQIPCTLGAALLLWLRKGRLAWDALLSERMIGNEMNNSNALEVRQELIDHGINVSDVSFATTYQDIDDLGSAADTKVMQQIAITIGNICSLIVQNI